MQPFYFLSSRSMTSATIRSDHRAKTTTARSSVNNGGRIQLFQKSPHMRRQNAPLLSPGSSRTAGRKNVLRKLLRIPYRRLKAGFSLCWLCLFVAGVLSEMHEVRTFAPCKAFYLTCLLFFRRLKITLDSEQQTLTNIPSVWGGIKGFEHFLRGEYFSDCVFD